MKLIILTLLPLLFLLFSCDNKNTYAKQIKEIDSLKVVLQEAVVNFNKIDSLKSYNAYAEQFTYSSFISANLRDTVSKSTAEDLQQFYTIGKNMVNFLAMKPKWTEEANTSVKQLTDLRTDLKAGNIEEEEVVEFITEEKAEALKLIEELKTNTELMRYSLEVFSKTLPTAQETIKKINGGALPEIIQPKITAPIETD